MPLADTPPEIVVLGALNSDFLICGERFPKPGETIQGNKFLAAGGGKGANQALAVARLGRRAALISCAGADSRGDELVSALAREGVTTRFVFRVCEQQTGAALIMVNASGEKAILAAPGANHSLNISHVAQSEQMIASAKILLTQFEAPLETVLAAMRIARRSGVTVVLDPAPALREVPDELFQLVDVIRPNAHEAEMLTGVKVTDRASAAKSAQVLCERGIRIVAVQAGDEGNLLVWEGREIWLPKADVQAIDATGAGDAFAAALAVALVEGQSPESAGTFCTAAAALTTTQLGAQPALPHRCDVDRLARSLQVRR